MKLPDNRTDELLAGYFREYVESFKGRERHTQSACEEETAYEKLVTYFFPNELKPQAKLYDKMMDVAVEYEESGFMAGYRMCLKHLLGQEQPFEANTTNTPPDEEQRQQGDVAASVDALDFISSMQIGEMFSAPNSKIVRRINNQILPHCSEDDRKEFRLASERNRQNKYIEVYRLSEKACSIYLEHIEKWSGMKSVTEGISKLRERMQSVFPAVA